MGMLGAGFALICSLAATTILADDDDHERARQLQAAGTILPLEAIVQRARLDYGGRILEVELENEDGKHIYEIELLADDGIVRELKYDAHSGALLQAERED